MKDDNAVIHADALLAFLIQNQAQLFSALKMAEDTGRDVGAFIAALRSRLIEMYEQTPR